MPTLLLARFPWSDRYASVFFLMMSAISFYINVSGSQRSEPEPVLRRRRLSSKQVPQTDPGDHQRLLLRQRLSFFDG
jgi:hypothetical protein